MPSSIANVCQTRLQVWLAVSITTEVVTAAVQHCRVSCQVRATVASLGHQHRHILVPHSDLTHGLQTTRKLCCSNTHYVAG